MSDKNFYKKLPELRLPIHEIFYDQNFHDVPADWYIIISDVKNSTAAVGAGKHNDVNLVAAGSLIAALNIAREQNIEIPFFFGGDGGTLLVPGEILNDVLAALKVHNFNSLANFGLEMHVGSISVKVVLCEGRILKIAKAWYGPGFNKAIVLGDGLQYAEQIIKEAPVAQEIDVEDTLLNLDGLECRWDRIKPPTIENEIVCYLVEGADPLKQAEVYRDVLIKVEEIYGNIEMRNPLSLHRLKLLLSFDKIKKEMMVRYGKWKANYFTNTFLKTFVGKLYFRYNWRINSLRGKEYLNQVIKNADTLIVDGRINTIITGKMDKRILFLNYLKDQELKGRLIFGHHLSKESVMTCYIENRNDKHIHFVDGADGGYTEAAKEFKLKQQQF
ncbi:MAG: DUF3095 family protein [Flavisolibacter sp.]|nr:DUF3095 family protein [Flavisolibacter sp.]